MSINIQEYKKFKTPGLRVLTHKPKIDLMRRKKRRRE
jgi:hypothetical protein